MKMKMINPFSVTFANIEFTLNKTSSIMLIINFVKVSVILGIAFYVAGKFSHPEPVKSDKIFFVCIHSLNNDKNFYNAMKNETSLFLKHLILLVNKLNNATSGHNNIDLGCDNVYCSFEIYDIEELPNMKIVIYMRAVLIKT